MMKFIMYEAAKRSVLARFSIVLLSLALGTSAFAQFTLVGNTSYLGNATYQLTKNSRYQSGGVWSQRYLDLSESFTIYSELYFGKNDWGADGIAFVLQPTCNGRGSAGGGMGYQGITPSLAVEFDTYRNYPAQDPAADHVAIQKNGDYFHGTSNKLAGPVSVSNLENDSLHSAIISWNASTKRMKLVLNGSTKIDQYLGNISSSIFSGNDLVYWGFTAATGSRYNDQRVKIDSMVATEVNPFVITPISCPNASDGAISMNIVGGNGPFTYEWSTGSTSSSISNLSAGTYTVDVTDNNNCVSQFSVDLPVGVDNTPPVAMAQDITVNLNSSGEANITAGDIDNGSYDACGAVTLSIDNDEFGCEEAFEYLTNNTTQPVILTVTDAAGNSSAATANVTVLYSGNDADCDGIGDECDQCPGGDDMGPCNATGYGGSSSVPASWLCHPNGKKVYICHKGLTLCISENGVNHHLSNHGDYLGPCASCTEPYEEEGQHDLDHHEHNGAELATTIESHENVIDFELYPSPASEMVVLSMNTPTKNASIVMRDRVGKTVFTDQLENNITSYSIDLTANALESGVYFISITSGNEKVTKRFIVSK